MVGTLIKTNFITNKVKITFHTTDPWVALYQNCSNGSGLLHI